MAQKKLEIILKKYENNPIIIGKINGFIENQLPRYIQSFIDKKERLKTLEHKMQEYMNAFYNSPDTRYFYIPISNTFVHYIRNSFQPIVEDKVWYHILTDISAKNTILMDWKYKVKTKLVKNIRERNIFDCIPESDTIQCILQFLVPTFFKTKEEAKYFLTIVGDNILKKNKHIKCLIHAKAQTLLDHLDTNSFFHFKTTISPTSTFRTAFIDTFPFSSYRLTPFSSTNTQYNSDFIRMHILDILVVATHYSTRFQNSDNYLQTFCHNHSLKKQILYLKDHSKQKLVEMFLQQNFDEGHGISTTDSFYIWKLFLKKEKLPCILGEDEFITLMQQCTEYDINSNFFPNIKGKKISQISIFKDFWNQQIFTKQDSYFEISELCSLCAKISPTLLGEKEMLALLDHFFPSVIIKQKKYVLNIGCKLWCKETDIFLFLKELKQKQKTISLYNAYEHYCKKQQLQVASKKYFEKKIQKILPNDSIRGNTLYLESWDP